MQKPRDTNQTTDYDQICRPCLTLFTSHSLPQADQSIGGALVNSMAQFGRAIGLAIGTAIQTAVMADARGTSVKDSGSLKAWDGPTLQGLQAAQYFNFALGAVSSICVIVAFRGLGTVGAARVKKKNASSAPEAPVGPGRSGGEEAIMDEGNGKA